MIRRRDWSLALPAALAALAGVAIAAIDSRPGWDDTGVTALLLVGTAFVAAAVTGRRPWLWVLLVGIWTPVIEIPATGQPASAAALLLTTIGALAGWGLARLTRRTDDEPRERPGAPPN